jgi:hypothetical protein
MSEWYDRQQEEAATRGPGSPMAATKRPPTSSVCFDVFSLFRPWQGCNRCTALLKAEEFVMPETDFSCPHVRRDEYTKLLTRLRNPGPHGPLLLENATFTNERGEVFGRVLWEEPDSPIAATKETRPRGIPDL